MRFLLRWPVVSLLFLALSTAGCDGNYPRREPPVAVRSFEVDFDVREADRAGPVRSVAFEAPELSRRVVERGLVMAYVRAQNAFDQAVWRALPHTYGVEFADGDEEAAVDYTVTLGFAYEVDFLEVAYEISADDPFVWEQLEDRAPRRIRVVAFSEDAVRRNPSLEVSSYEAVQQRFGLPR